MHRYLVLFTVGAAFLALSSAACGDSKPPLTPDSEHSDLADAGAPSPASSPAAPASSAAPAKK